MRARKRKAPTAATVRASNENPSEEFSMAKANPAATRNQVASNVVQLFGGKPEEGFRNPYAMDPKFRVWCMWQNRLAVEAELPYESHQELAKRYVRLMAEKAEAIKRARKPGGMSMLHEMAEAFA